MLIAFATLYYEFICPHTQCDDSIAAYFDHQIGILVLVYCLQILLGKFMVKKCLLKLWSALSLWINVEKIEDIDRLRQLEDLLTNSLNRFHEYQVLLFFYIFSAPIELYQTLTLFLMERQFQNVMNLHLMMDNAEETKPLTWLSNKHDNQATMLRDSQNFFSQGLVNAHKLQNRFWMLLPLRSLCCKVF